jgi:hypothetical protein
VPADVFSEVHVVAGVHEHDGTGSGPAVATCPKAGSSPAGPRIRRWSARPTSSPPRTPPRRAAPAGPAMRRYLLAGLLACRPRSAGRRGCGPDRPAERWQLPGRAAAARARRIERARPTSSQQTE